MKKQMIIRGLAHYLGDNTNFELGPHGNFKNKDTNNLPAFELNSIIWPNKF
jgi:hypothetical protein